MRRDNELMAKILLALEADDPPTDINGLAFLGDNIHTINGHVSLLHDRGLVGGEQIGPTTIPERDHGWVNIFLTDAGHDALENTRKDTLGRRFLDHINGLGHLSAPAIVAAAISHPDYLVHFVDVLRTLM